MSSGCIKVLGRSVAVACAFVALGVVGQAASASTVIGNTLAPLPPNIIGVRLDGVNGVNNQANGSWSGSVFAGGIEWSRIGGSSTQSFFDYNFTTGDGTLSLSKFTSYCIDIVEDVYVPYGPYRYDVKDPTQAPLKAGYAYDLITPLKAQLLAALWGEHIQDSFTMTSAGGQAAFQAAVWNIVFDNDYTVTYSSTAHFSMTDSPDIASLANQWLGDAKFAVDNNVGPRAKLLALTSPTVDGDGGVSNSAQDQLVAVPLPASVQAGGVLIGLLGLGKLFRTVRRRRASV